MFFFHFGSKSLFLHFRPKLLFFEKFVKSIPDFLPKWIFIQNGSIFIQNGPHSFGESRSRCLPFTLKMVPFTLKMGRSSSRVRLGNAPSTIEERSKSFDFRIRAEAISRNPNSHPRSGRSITRQELKRNQPTRTTSEERTAKARKSTKTIRIVKRIFPKFGSGSQVTIHQ